MNQLRKEVIVFFCKFYEFIFSINKKKQSKKKKEHSVVIIWCNPLKLNRLDLWLDRGWL